MFTIKRRSLFANLLRTTLNKRRTFNTSKCLSNIMELQTERVSSGRKYFSGIKPSGTIHLGNYLGAIQRWNSIKDNNEDITLCIADMHSLATSQDPVALRKNIFNTAAAIFACGIDPNETTVFVQSAVPEHFEMCWILNCHTTMNRLAHIPEFQEKSRKIKDILLGFYVYPILQASDVILHKATHVPVGDDQVQNLNFAQTLIQSLNSDYGMKLPICQAFVEKHEAARIRSFKDPTKKMSKSESDPKATVLLTDSADEIVDKFKKSTTDCISDIAYDPNSRPGISNLIAIYSLVTNKPINDIIREASVLDGSRFKLMVGEAVAEHLRPITERIKVFLDNQNEIINVLEAGAEKARREASSVLQEIKQRMGLGACNGIPEPLIVPQFAPILQDNIRKSGEIQPRKTNVETPIVPVQQMRVEKRRATESRMSSSPSNVAHFDGINFPTQRNADFSQTYNNVKKQASNNRYGNKF